MKVVFLSHMFPNAITPFAAPFMIERAKALAALVHIEVVAPVSFFPVLRSNLPPFFESFNGVKVCHARYLALPAALWGVRWLPYFRVLKKTFASTVSNFDLLHIEWIYPDAYAAVRYARKKDIKTVGVVHGNEAIEYFGPKSHRKKYIETFTALDRIIVVSADLKGKLINDYSVDPQKISIILNGVDIKKFPIEDKINARERLGLSDRPYIGVCVARLSEEKNLDVLIKAVSELSDKSPYIYIVGDGPLKVQLQEMIDLCGVGNKVKLVGPVPHDKVALWLNAADFFCLPSQREGCPVVIHEALACGVPVISTAVGAIPDLIKDERFGLLCEPDNVAAFTEIIKRAMPMKWNRELISFYGRQFTWDNVAKQTIDVFKSVLEPGR